MDCMVFMKDVPDKFYELAVVDPPYGIGDKKLTQGGTWASKYKKGDCDWDVAPSLDYFRELQRVSKNWIIWGGNYFTHYIKGSRCFIVWRKLQMLGMHTMADCELALTSFDKNAKIFDSNNSENRIHPTQKPIKLYEWLLMNYAKEGDKILDTHGGSQSSRIACYNLGYALDIIELDKEYFDQGNKRFETHKQQLTLF